MTLAEGLSLEELVHRSNAYRALLARIEALANKFDTDEWDFMEYPEANELRRVIARRIRELAEAEGKKP